MRLCSTKQSAHISLIRRRSRSVVSRAPASSGTCTDDNIEGAARNRLTADPSISVTATGEPCRRARGPHARPPGSRASPMTQSAQEPEEGDAHRGVVRDVGDRAGEEAAGALVAPRPEGAGEEDAAEADGGIAVGEGEDEGADEYRGPDA